MKAASLKEIKDELAALDHDVVVAACVRLARYKVENKELLTYLLFEAHNESSYIDNVKDDVSSLFDELPSGNLYYVKKSLRKILRFLSRQVKYSGIATTEVELRIFFCSKIREKKIPLKNGTVLYNLYQQQLKKIKSVLKKMPEDLQADYEHGLDQIDYS